MSTFFRSALFSALLTACGGGLDPYSERSNLLDPASINRPFSSNDRVAAFFISGLDV